MSIMKVLRIRYACSKNFSIRMTCQLGKDYFYLNHEFGLNTKLDSAFLLQKRKQRRKNEKTMKKRFSCVTISTTWALNIFLKRCFFKGNIVSLIKYTIRITFLLSKRKGKNKKYTTKI